MPVHGQGPASLSEEDEEHGGVDFLALPQRNLSGDFCEALSALLGPGAPGLSATTVVRLKKSWEEEHQDGSRRSLVGKDYVYICVDGIHFNIRRKEERQCILVFMEASFSKALPWQLPKSSGGLDARSSMGFHKFRAAPDICRG